MWYLQRVKNIVEMISRENAYHHHHQHHHFNGGNE